MSSDTITRLHLVDAIYKEVGVTRSDATVIFDTILETIADLLQKNGEVKINRFGSFICKQKAERIGRNPKTGKEVTIPAHYAVSFKPAQALKTTVESSPINKKAA